MKIKVLKTGTFSLNGSSVSTFFKDEILGIGDKGLTEKNLLRMLDPKVRIDVELFKEDESIPTEEVEEDLISEEVEEESVSDEEVESEETPNEPEKEVIELAGYEQIDNKDDLDEFAKLEHKIELDKRKSLKNMKIQLAKQLEANNGE